MLVVPEVFEKLQRYEEALEAAQTDIRNLHTPSMVIHSHIAAGRACAKIGNVNDAVMAFEAAIGEAHRSELPFLEMLARRDYIVHVLDEQGKRESQMGPLGACISRMVLPPEKYSPVLGSDIDAAAAVVAFQLTQK